MEISMTDKANILIEALPYIQKYCGKIVVVKYGGAAMTSPLLKAMVMSDIALLSTIGIKAVLVHGGGKEIDTMLKKVGIESHFVNGLRYTSKEAMEIVNMILSGKVNKELVAGLESYGAKAVGLSGTDANLISAKKIEGEFDYGFVGDIEKINEAVIIDLLDKGYVPIISSVGKNKDGELFNINADTAACAIASKLKAENLILLSDVKGLYKNPNDSETFMPELNISDIPRFISEGVISGGMIPKIQGIAKSIVDGVKKAIILDGREAHSILIELLSDNGVGTLINNN